MAKITIVYYSSTGNTYQLALAAKEGAEAVGAEVRLRKAKELAPAVAIDSNPAWRKHLDATKDIPEATPDDLEWADGYIFGTPTRFGLPSAQLKQFIDLCGGKWFAGKLQDKVAGAFSGAGNIHGGQESTLLALQNVFYHWGAIIVPVGYTDPLLYAAGGNPYGVSYTDAQGADLPDEKLVASRYQGERIARYAKVISANLASLTAPGKE
ncbi:NAD(P)H:quinone oxidoreductase [Edaphovirga cremea]|jgi:NAD(P)H dehydrogenase (quinone)|uniref:NAD(P)H:quinone oxidoreductase n=1 Tax=Edaphovirga cremea TaxID=2267246 RepID=UPI000DEF9233|nr:NAD(P)H:quinone oxidoreductase [Edaphovirga cremea]